MESVKEDSPPQSPQYEELLEVVTHAVAKLNVDCPAEKQAEPQKSKLDERFLRARSPPPRWSLPFFLRSSNRGDMIVGQVILGLHLHPRLRLLWQCGGVE